MAAGRGATLPLLTGLPVVLKGANDLQVNVAYCRAVLNAGVFPAGLWTGSPEKFLADGLADFISRHGGNVADKVFHLEAWLSSHSNSFTSDDGRKAFLTCDLHTVSVVCFRPIYRKLESLKPGCGVAFIRRFLRAFSRWWPTYDFRDAECEMESRQDQLAESIAEENAAAKSEGREPNMDGLEEIELEFPEITRGMYRGRKFCPGVMPRTGPDWYLKLLGQLRDMEREIGPPREFDEIQEQFMDAEPSVPILFAHMYPDDQLQAWCDEHLEYKSQCDCMPAYIDVIDETQSGQVVAAFKRFGAALRVLSAAAAMIYDLPGNRQNRRRD